MFDDLKYRYARLDASGKLIVWNVALFVTTTLLALFFPGRIWTYLELPAYLPYFLQRPWTLLTYGFLHSGLLHLLFNMLWLFFLGRMVLNLFAIRVFHTVYFLGILVGGLAFLAAYNLIPGLVPAAPRTVVVGASAAVSALMLFLATYTPNQEIRFFFFNLKLWHLAAFFVVVDVLRLGGSNTGGMIAHIGGYAWGFAYARLVGSGRDFSEALDRSFRGLAGAFRRKERSPFKKVYKGKGGKAGKKASPKGMEKDERQRRIDAILDKIGKSGYDSLSKSEKDFLFKAGKEEG